MVAEVWFSLCLISLVALDLLWGWKSIHTRQLWVPPSIRGKQKAATIAVLSAWGVLAGRALPSWPREAVQLVAGVAGLWALSRYATLGWRVLREVATDPLTGLFHMQAALEVAEERTRRGGIGVVVIDVDEFKQWNDRWGHVAGDWLLKRIANIIRDNIRTEDVAARWGGDEFVVLVPGSKSEVTKVADRLHRVISTELASSTVSVSIGVAWAERGRSLTTLMQEADWEMYRHKRNEQTAQPTGWKPVCGLGR